mmetsp:Transcript_11382/g.13101  ORF Transcript_11382/g.13101 Transcript_11382/m.13101 type:complete len:183 (+) Transcript_11382:198-746(+)
MKSKAFNNNALFTMVAVVTMMIASPIVVLVEARIGNTNGLHSSIINHQTGSSTGMGTRHRATTRTFAENIFTNKSSGVSDADETDTPTTLVATTTVTATKQKQKQLTTNGSANKPLPSYEDVMHNAQATPGHGRYVDQTNGKNLASFCGRHNKFNKSDCYQHHDALRGKGHQEEEHQHQRGD